MDIKDMEIFCKLAQNKSFSKTAKDFYLSQPAISKHINLLEKELNIKLLNRTTKYVSLTRAGEIFYEKSLKILREVNSLKLLMKDFSEIGFGEITVGASTLPGEYLLPDFMEKFKNKFPKIDFNIIIKDSLKIVEEVASGVIEIGIVGSMFKKKGLQFSEFLQDEIVFAGKEKVKNRISLNTLKKLPIITREHGSGTINTVKEFLKSKGINYDNLQFVAKVGSLNAVKQIMLKGMGYSFISKTAIEEEVKDGKLHIIELNKLTPIKRNFYIVYSKNFTLSPAAEELRKLLIDFKK